MELRNIKLLLVEDDLIDQLAFKRLEKENTDFFSYRIAGSIKAARELLGAGQFDVIICDYFLGDGNAFDILEISGDIPVIFATGAGNEEVAVKALRAGAFDYLIKDNARNYLKVLPITIENAIRHKQAQKELRKLSLVTSKSNNAVIITDKEGRIEWVNEGFTKLSGYGLHEVIGTSGELLRRGDKTGLSPGSYFFNEMLLNKKTVSYETRNYSKSGREYWVLTTLTPLLDQHENIENIVAIDSDITERKMAEEVILAAKAAAEEAKQAEEEFLANTSHEIRTPMTGILGMVNLLLQSDLNSMQEEYLNDIRISANKLLYIINDILDFSKIRAGQITFETVEFRLDELTGNILKILGNRIREKNLDVSLSIDPAIPAVLTGDPVRLNQVLLNLLDNAVKFTPQGSVSLKITPESGAAEGSVRLLFTVADTGIGIAPDKQSQIFESFKQAGSDTTRKYGGTGLGLSIAQKLIQSQGSGIYVESEPGKGTVFHFMLDFGLSDHASFTAGDDEQKMQFPGPLHILVAEDNQINQKVLSNMLSSLGATVEIAGDGRSAIGLLERRKDFDIILMDLRMPEMDGFTTTQHIRNKLPYPVSGIPVVAITASALASEREECFARGMNDYISKPFSRETIYKTILRNTNPGNTGSARELNTDRLRQFQRNNSNFVQEIIGIFISETPADLEAIHKAFAEDDLAAVEQIAHRVGPSAAMIGFDSLHEAFRALEIKARERNRRDTEQLIAGIDSLFADALSTLEGQRR
jgi:PAS domain S-box-containing protein